MITDQHCPTCGLRLYEVKKEIGWVICKHSHLWQWQIINNKTILREV